MIFDEPKEWLAFLLAVLGGIAAWYNAKSRSDVISVNVNDIKSETGKLKDKINGHELALNKLQLNEARAQENRENQSAMILDIKEMVHGQSKSNLEFQSRVIRELERLSTTVNERTKELHSRQ
jgi:hypothetical protein